MSLLDIFKDDKTKQYSLARISAALVLLDCLVWSSYLSFATQKSVDIPGGKLTLVLGLYGINKITSNVTADKPLS